MTVKRHGLTRLYEDRAGFELTENPEGSLVHIDDYATLERVAVALRDALHNLVTGSSGKSRGKEWDDAELALSQASSLPEGKSR